MYRTKEYFRCHGQVSRRKIKGLRPLKIGGNFLASIKPFTFLIRGCHTTLAPSIQLLPLISSLRLLQHLLLQRLKEEHFSKFLNSSYRRLLSQFLCGNILTGLDCVTHSPAVRPSPSPLSYIMMATEEFFLL
jgi:hypothetical protein